MYLPTAAHVFLPNISVSITNPIVPAPPRKIPVIKRVAANVCQVTVNPEQNAVTLAVKAPETEEISSRVAYTLNWPVSSVVTKLLLVRRSGVRFPGRSNRTQCRKRLATVVTFFRSSVAKALSRRDGLRHSLHAPA